MRIVSKRTKNVGEDLYKKLYRLNAGDNGLMRDYLKYRYGTVFVAMEKDVVLGWAIKKEDYTQLYVRARCRRKGIGTKLYKAVKKKQKKFHVSYWCAPDFFNSVKHKF